MKLRNILLFLVLTYTAVLAQPKEEVRAVWLTTAWGLDWPAGASGVTAQKQALIRQLDQLKAANFNTIYFQARTRGDVFWKSEIEPWSVYLTGTLGQDPGYDPLQFAIEEAHKRGMELHAWVVVYKVWGTNTPPATNPPHVVLSHPEWVKMYGTEGYYIDPGYPEANEYLIKLYMEMVRNYDIDAIHFDYIRYPNPDFNDADSYSKYGGGGDKADWRRSNINKFVYAIYDSIQAVKPDLKVGTAAIGMYRSGSWPSYYDVYQDSKGWMDAKKHDYLAPQTYMKLGTGNPKYEWQVDWWTKYVGSKAPEGRHIYAASPVYKMLSSEGNFPLSEIVNQIDTLRYFKSHGQSYFRTAQITGNLKGIYDHLKNVAYKYPANIPPMPWKDSVKAEAPQNLKISTTDSLKFTLTWDKSAAAADGDTAVYYNVYRDTKLPVDISDVKNIAAFQVMGKTSVEIAKPEGNYYYVVTAYDNGYNESGPSNASSIITGVEDEIAAVENFNLDQNYPNPFNPVTGIKFSIPAAADVQLRIYDVLGNEVAVLAEGRHDAGTHTVEFNAAGLPSGMYIYTITAGSYSASRKMMLLK